MLLCCMFLQFKVKRTLKRHYIDITYSLLSAGKSITTTTSLIHVKIVRTYFQHFLISSRNMSSIQMAEIDLLPGPIDHVI